MKIRIASWSVREPTKNQKEGQEKDACKKLVKALRDLIGPLMTL